MTPKERHAELSALIDQWNQAYYQHNTSPVSDGEYDVRFKELKALEAEHPKLVTLDSPTQRVGWMASNQFKKVKHPFPMLSLSNQFNAEELFGWVKTLPADTTVYGEVKLDGVSLELIYIDGQLHQAITRGDGEVGEDVTINALEIDGIPKRLPHHKEGSYAVIRGEVVIHKDDFTAINQALVERGLQPFATARNCASGSVRQKDPKVTATRRLKFYPYSYHLRGTQLASHSTGQSLLAVAGFTVAPSVRGFKSNEVTEEVLTQLLEDLHVQRDTFPFDIDGIVWKVDDTRTQEQLGFRSREPRWATASKFTASEGQSVLRGVKQQVGRTGVITPVADLDPVLIGGTLISSPTLHNWAEIRRLDLYLGDTVVVKRAGDVIPKITHVIKELRPTHAVPVTVPTVCPECGGAVREDDVAVYCINSVCTAQLSRAIEHAVSRKALNVMHLGTSGVEALINAGLVQSLPDLLRLSLEDLKTIPEFGDRVAEKIHAELVKARTQPLSRLLFALGIPETGEGTSKRLAQVYKDLGDLRKTTVSELEAIRDIGAITAQAIVQWFTANGDMLDQLESLVEIVPVIKVDNLPLEGKTVVVTGSKFNGRKRKEVEVEYEALGAKISSSVSRNTYKVIAGTKATLHKLTTAREFGIPIEQFEE
jgi:DNA ligase (NAD+)